ncbi:MAG: radical SAM protein [Lachnospiraceae bacterium]|nr:radical SAM protein [Lachnospiraceae bacterium]
MQKEFDIQEYMTAGVERIVSDALKATLSNPAESAFMLKFAAASKKASAKRAAAKKNGENIPPFLIASITSSCNLHCAGCYSRCNHATTDTEPVSQLSGEEWQNIFEEADQLGVSFILLAGGEPLLRRDVIEAAGNMRNILFPIFTNGTFIGDQYLEMFTKNRNLVPVLSIEGNREVTDNRRGAGVYDKFRSGMDALCERKLIFGVSVTVTTENINEVTSAKFIEDLKKKGCKLVLYVEFVPVTEESSELAPGDAERQQLKEFIDQSRTEYEDMVFVSFPGDEKSSGGCIAAGRGFFHINSHGGAEPCPFSPYSDVNVRDTSLREAIHSELFRILKDGDYLKDDHNGGCVLYEKRKEVERIIENKR